MNEIVTGNNSTVVIDDKDTYNLTKNKTVVKSDNSQIELDLKTIIELLNNIVSLINTLPVTNTQKEVDNE